MCEKLVAGSGLMVPNICRSISARERPPFLGEAAPIFFYKSPAPSEIGSANYRYRKERSTLNDQFDGLGNRMCSSFEM